MKTYTLILALFSCCLYAHDSYYNTDHYQNLFDKANGSFAKGKHEKAIKRYRELLHINDKVPQVHFNLAVVLIQGKQYEEAIHHLKRAIELKANYPKAYYQLGLALDKSKRKDEAEQMYRKAHELDPNYFDVLPALAGLVRDGDRFKEAIEYYHRAAKLRPREIQVLLDLANALNIDNQTEEALEWYLKMLEIIPDNPSILYNIAYTYKKLNRLEDAMPYYQRVLTIQPNHAEAHFSYGLALLLTGNRNAHNWAEGWKQYEWRWKRDSQQMRHYTQPMWDGSDLHGKTIFLWAEQGLGDTFEFIRYAKIAKELGARKVIVAVQKPLLDIARQLPYIDQLIWTQDSPPYFDVHAPMLSMPYLTKTGLHNTPAEIPYLHADQNLVDEWKEILKQDTNFKIGICWQGNPNYSTQFLRQAVAAKSMTVTQFLPIIELRGVTVYSLQKMTGTDQLKELPEDAPLVLFGDDFDTHTGRFMDTAAVIKNLDLVVTIDTSISHLAAGLGVPTWNLLPNPPDWRWMLDCDDTPWFPNMRLFRQPNPGDWESVINSVVKELKAHLAYGKPLIVHENPYHT